jgi:hypothetical protein
MEAPQMESAEHYHAARKAFELTGTESGSWQVFTRDSSHIFDFEEGSVTRVPGPHAWPGSNDRPHPLRTIEACKVGFRGLWTMKTDGWSDTIDYLWHSSSVIERIVRIPDADAPHEVNAAEPAEVLDSDPSDDPGDWRAAAMGEISDDEVRMDLVVEALRQVLGTALVGDLVKTRVAEAINSNGFAIQPSAEDEIRLLLAFQTVANLRHGHLTDSQIAEWFTTPLLALGARSPAQTIRDEDPYLAQWILTDAARQFLTFRTPGRPTAP